MGCWNGTCGITGLPIWDCDPVVAVIIYAHTKKFDLTPSYPCEWYAPATPLLRGKYDDGGGVSLSKEQKELAQLFCDKLRVDTYDQDTFHTDVIPAFKINQIHGSVHYVWWMAHEAIYDRLVSEGCDHHMGFRYNGYGKPTINNIVEHRIEDARKAFLSDDRMAGHAFRNALELQDRPMPILSKMAFKVENVNQNVEDTLALIADLQKLYLLMMKLRINMAPPAGCGSQDQDLQIYKLRNKMIEDLIKEREAEYYASDYGESDELTA